MSRLFNNICHNLGEYISKAYDENQTRQERIKYISMSIKKLKKRNTYFKRTHFSITFKKLKNVKTE
jgi:hypothetical protein